MSALAYTICDILKPEGIQFENIFFAGFMAHVMPYLNQLALKSTGQKTEPECQILQEMALDVERIQMDYEEGQLPRVIFVAPPGLNYMLGRVKLIYVCLAAMCERVAIPMVVCGETLRLYSNLSNNLSGITMPTAWRFFADLSQCLPAVGLSGNVRLTYSDNMGCDLYLLYKNNIDHLGMSNSAMDLVEYSRPDLGLLQPENPDQPGGIKESQLFAEAYRKTLQSTPAVYEKVVVSRGGWFGGQKRFVSAGVLPEPARAKEPEQQPGATENAHLDMLRKLVHREVVLKVKENDRWSQWLAVGGMPIRRLLEIFPEDFDEMTALQFIEGIGETGGRAPAAPCSRATCHKWRRSMNF